MADRRDRQRPALEGECPRGPPHPLEKRPAGRGRGGAAAAGDRGHLRLRLRGRGWPALYSDLRPRLCPLGEAVWGDPAGDGGTCAPGPAGAGAPFRALRRSWDAVHPKERWRGVRLPGGRGTAGRPGERAGGTGRAGPPLGRPPAGTGGGRGGAGRAGLAEKGVRPALLHPGAGAGPVSQRLGALSGAGLPADGPHVSVSEWRSLRLPGPAPRRAGPAAHCAGAGPGTAGAGLLPPISGGRRAALVASAPWGGGPDPDHRRPAVAALCAGGISGGDGRLVRVRGEDLLSGIPAPAGGGAGAV